MWTESCTTKKTWTEKKFSRNKGKLKKKGEVKNMIRKSEMKNVNWKKWEVKIFIHKEKVNWNCEMKIRELCCCEKKIMLTEKYAQKKRERKMWTGNKIWKQVKWLKYEMKKCNLKY